MSQKADENFVAPPKEETIFDSSFFKLLTLGIYLAGVSGLGFCISVYLIFIWDSKMPPIPDIHHPQHHPPGYLG